MLSQVHEIDTSGQVITVSTSFAPPHLALSPLSPKAPVEVATIIDENSVKADQQTRVKSSREIPSFNWESLVACSTGDKDGVAGTPNAPLPTPLVCWEQHLAEQVGPEIPAQLARLDTAARRSCLGTSAMLPVTAHWISPERLLGEHDWYSLYCKITTNRMQSNVD